MSNETVIVVTDKIHLVFSKGVGSNVGTYSPRVFRPGGDKYHDPRTKTWKETEDKWEDVSLYFTNLAHALRWCAQEQQHTGETVSLDEYIKKCEKVWVVPSK